MSPLTTVKFSISDYALLALGHLREHYALSELEAKYSYKIENLSLVIDELVEAGHVVYQIPRPANSPRTYTLFEFKDNEPKLLKLLTRTKQRLFSSEVAA
jgi:hypothetical protein